MRYLVFALIFLMSGSAIGAPAVQAVSNTSPATSPKLYTNEPYDITTCNTVPNGTVMGRVTSSTTI